MRRMCLAVCGLVLGVALVTAGVRAEQGQDAAVIDKTMKTVGPAFGALRKAVEANAAADIRTQATALSTAFAETEAFFQSHGKADGVEMAQAAKKGAEALAAGATDEAATSAAGAVGKTCAGCHAKYRDRTADGAYTFKPGA